MNNDSVRAKLIEDTGSPETADALARRLTEWSAPQPAAADTARLVAGLQAELPRAARRPQPWLWLLLRAQIKVLRGELWAGSALVMLLGVGVTLAIGSAELVEVAFPFVVLAPVVAAVGVAFLYGPANDPAYEIELAAPLSPRLILLARLALLFGFDLALGLLASLALAALRADISLGPLVTAWLAPMTFLSALAFLLSTLTPDPLAGISASMLLWLLEVVARMAHLGLPLPDLFAPASHGWMFVLAAGLALAGLWLGGHEERWLMHTA